MSDSYTTADFYADSGGGGAVESPEDAAPDFGQGEAEDSNAAEPQGEAVVPERQYFDPSTVADQYVSVKVDGEDIEVPVSEVLQGYQRQADYTRKTQELAQQRQNIEFWQQVDEAAKVNPELTLQYLQQHYGIGQQAEPEPSDDDWGFDAEDPVAQRLQQIEQMVAPAVQYAQQQQASQLLDQVVTGLTQKYGDEFDSKEVIQVALDRGIYDPHQFENIYRELAFDRYRAAAAAKTETQQSRQQGDAQRQAAAQAASSTVTSGGSSSGYSAPASKPNPKPTTIAESWALAKAQLDVS